MTGAADSVFVDTNVLVHAATLSSPLNTEARQGLKEREESGVELCLSRQVLREYLAVMTRQQGQNRPLPISVAISAITSALNQILNTGEDWKRKYPNAFYS